MKKDKIKGLVASVVIITMSFGLCGCGNKSTDNRIVVEMVQYKPEAADYFEQLEKEFNATHDDIQLKIDSPNDAMTILKTRFIREDNPDIIGIGGDSNFSNFIDANMLMDISDYDGLEMIKENYLAINKDLEFVPQEGIYAVPYAANAAGILYNKDMFDEAGIDYPDGSWTWDEFYDIAEKLTKEDGSQYGFAANPSNEQDTWMNIIYSMGGCVLTDDNKSGFDDPNTIKAMEFVDKCVKNVMPPASTMSETGTDVLFGSGKVAMISQGSWMVSGFKDNDYIKEHCDVARLPKDAETGRSVSLYNGLGWAASFQLIEWFGSKDMQKKQADLGVTMAAYEGMSDGWVNSVDCFNLQPYMDAMDDIVFRPHTNATLAWWNPMCEELKKPWNDEESMDDACKNIVTIMNDAIAEESY